MVGVKIGLVSVEVEIGLLLLLFPILFAPFDLVVSTLNFRGLSVLSDLDLPHMIPHCLCFHSQFNRRLRGTLLVVSSCFGRLIMIFRGTCCSSPELLEASNLLILRPESSPLIILFAEEMVPAI